MNREYEVAKRERELEHEIAVTGKQGWSERWGDARTWIYVTLLILWPISCSLMCWLLVGGHMMTGWNLGHPATAPG
ncbi:MAG TPA: hypothetical protein VFJ58_01055 [Armatimonadota bacterium]|nr:hypothetical protein [Armatimonadota bacterium]